MKNLKTKNNIISKTAFIFSLLCLPITLMTLSTLVFVDITMSETGQDLLVMALLVTIIFALVSLILSIILVVKKMKDVLVTISLAISILVLVFWSMVIMIEPKLFVNTVGESLENICYFTGICVDNTPRGCFPITEEYIKPNTEYDSSGNGQGMVCYD